MFKRDSSLAAGAAVFFDARQPNARGDEKAGGADAHEHQDLPGGQLAAQGLERHGGGNRHRNDEGDDDAQPERIDRNYKRK